MVEEKIKSLVCSEVASIQNPEDPNDIYVFPYVDELVEFLLYFLKYPCGIQSIDGIDLKVLGALSIFAETQLELQKLPGALEDIATGFESFLKKIAYFRYKDDPIKLNGDGVKYLGLFETTLGGLLEGKVAKVNPRDGTIPKLVAPIVTFTYSERNIREIIYDRIRNLRNDIHKAPKRSVFDLMRLFRLATAAYLFALEENICVVRRQIDPLFIYLARIEKKFDKWEYRYVELVSEEKKDVQSEYWPELQAFEWRDEADDLISEELPWERMEEDPKFEPSQPQVSIRTSVLELAGIQSRFWLIGEPGAGKSTSLQTLVWRRAKELLGTGYVNKPCPVLIAANQFDSSYSFMTLVSDTLKVDIEQVDVWLSKGKLWLLIDGVNEIASTEEVAAYREIERLLNRYEDVAVILSSRKYGFHQRFSLSVFELLPLTDEMIFDYIKRHMPSTGEGEKFFDSLISTQSVLLDFARNPLMLRMLVKVVRHGEIPTNRGQLFRLFINWIFSREKDRKLNQVDEVLKEKILASIAFRMRARGKTRLPSYLVLKTIDQTLAEWHAETSVSGAFHELLDNHILEIDANETVTFFHELVLEYFSAVQLHYLYVNKSLNFKIAVKCRPGVYHS